MAEKLSRSFTQKELQLYQPRHKQQPPQSQFAKLTHNNQIKSVPDIFKHESVFLSQKADRHPTLDDFGNYQWSLRDNDEKEEKNPFQTTRFFFISSCKTFWKSINKTNQEKHQGFVTTIYTFKRYRYHWC